MGFITRYRGHLLDYLGSFDESMLLQEITLDEYLAFQYPSFLLEHFPEQARSDRDNERDTIQMAAMPGDTFWLWRHVDELDRTDGSSVEWGGLALRRAGKVIRVWLVWAEH
jgi:hypothetical protein